jgi:hypothetical protein
VSEDHSAVVSPNPPVRITVETRLNEPNAETFYRLYLTAFGPLRTEAVARQVLHREEFLADMVDPRVHKYVAWDEAGQPRAMATITRHLEVVPWISPEYFSAHYPDQASRHAIYYLGLALVDPRHGGEGLLERLIVAGLAPLVEAGALCAFDVCGFNRVHRGMVERVQRIVRRHADCVVEEIDTQFYYAVSFGAPAAL